MTTDGVIPYEMALLQFTQKATSEERINIGVAVFSPETKEGAFRLSERYGRLASVYPGFDGASYRGLIRHMRRRLHDVLGGDGGEQRRLPPDMNHIEDAIGFLAAVGNDNFMWSRIRYGICADLQARTDELYAEFVLQLEGASGRERVDGNALWDLVRAHAAFQPIAAELQPAIRIHAPLYDYVFKAGWRNGTQQVVEPISLDYQRPGEMVEEANKWRGRLDQLTEKNDFYLTAIITPPPTGAAAEKYLQAKQILQTSPRVRGVYDPSEIEDFTTLVRDDIATH
jgi:hypothetical protein